MLTALVVAVVLFIGATVENHFLRKALASKDETLEHKEQAIRALLATRHDVMEELLDLKAKQG